jgi:hypothetical protein
MCYSQTTGYYSDTIEQWMLVFATTLTILKNMAKLKKPVTKDHTSE